MRNSPLAGVLLTNADVDHVIGLYSLREGERLQIHATTAVQRAAGQLGVTRVLEAFCGVDWREPPTGKLARLRGKEDRETNLLFRAIPLSGSAPRYLGKISDDGIYSVAYQIVDERSGARVLVAPGVAALSGALQEAARDSTAVLMDGTFWSEDELRCIKPGAATASEMGHLPIRDGTLPFLRGLPCRHKIYVHINNTNPILDPGSAERAAVEAAGVTVGWDGMSLEL